MEKQSFSSAIEQICEEKGISKEKVIETIEMAIAAAYKKDYGQKGQIIRAKFDPATGQTKISQIKIVVDESMLKPELTEEEAALRQAQGKLAEAQDIKEAEPEEEEGEKKVRFNPEKHIMIEEAKKIKKKVKPGDEIEFSLKTHEEYGRIAAQTAKQVIIQRIREAERESIYDEYKAKEGELVSGVVQRLERGNVFLDIGKTTGIIFPEEQIPREYYRLGQRLRVYILEVQKDPRGPAIILSRAHPKIVSKLFALEVPEISNGTVQIKSIAREPGSRTKIAVASTEEGVDPIGSCFPGKSLVLMEDFTYKPIVQLSKGEAVFTHLGNRELITQTYKRTWNGTLLEFKIFGVHRGIEVTKEHPLLFAAGYESKIEFREASKIKTGYLAIPTFRKVIFDKTIHHFEKEKDFLWVLGMYLAEGSLDRAEVNFTLSRQEKDKALKIKNTMEKYGGKVFIRESKYRPAVLDVILFGNYWREVFKELGSQYCDRKKISPRLMFLDPKLQLEIFKGWRDGDGYLNQKRNRTIVVTTSEELLWQMYHILLRNKIRANMQKRKEGRKMKLETYQLEIFHNKTRDYRGFFRGDYYFSRIRNIEKVPRCCRRRVYNLEVNNDNSYIVYSIGVHNCVGQKGTRVQAVINELGGEKIDIIEWSDEPSKFIAKALAPAKVIDVEIAKKGNQAKVMVPEDQLSLAIGIKGQNVRLAAKLTGWKIDVVAAEKVEAEKKKEKKVLKKKVAKKVVKEKKEKKEKEKKEKKVKKVTKKKRAALK